MDLNPHPALTWKGLFFQNRWEQRWQILIKVTCEKRCYLITFETKPSQITKALLSYPCCICRARVVPGDCGNCGFFLSGRTVQSPKKNDWNFFSCFSSPFWCPNRGDFFFFFFRVVLDFTAKERLGSPVALELSCSALVRDSGSLGGFYLPGILRRSGRWGRLPSGVLTSSRSRPSCSAGGAAILGSLCAEKTEKSHGIGDAAPLMS